MTASAMEKAAVVSTKRGNNHDLINEQASKELIFAVVGPIGSGTTEVAKKIAHLAGLTLNTEHVVHIKASDVIAHHANGALPDMNNTNKLLRAKALQNYGDALRKGDESAVAALISSEIKQHREKFGASDAGGGVSALHPGKTEDKHKVYVIDSLKHPAEVELLRTVYREAFCLIGVVCEEKTRTERLLLSKCKDSSSIDISILMRRDEGEGEDDWGQKVSKTFHLADFFVDNTPNRMTEDNKENKEWDVPEKLGRLLDILDGKKIVRPLPSETGMFHAAGAQLRSACLSRQVGAALLAPNGNLIATGTNEVPKYGGGVYGSDFLAEEGDAFEDARCAFTNKYCSNNKEQAKIMDEVISSIPELNLAVDKTAIKKALKETALGRLLEFSRAVHAEMDAILSAAREGASTVGTKLFVTTFPCHYCARHIVAAGVEEVQYIEPYPKSKALELHSDAIEGVFSKWVKKAPEKPTKALFRPFTGVAPRLYTRAFMKNRKLKNGEGDLDIGRPKWAPGLLKKSYIQVEQLLETPDDQHN